jgi:hypothetical protein
MHDLIDLTRYPLSEPGSQGWHDLVARCRAELADNGMYNLDGFLKPAAIERAVGELAPKLASESFRHARRHNIYFEPEVPGLPADHPALKQMETVNHTVCADQIPGSVVMQLYHWPGFARFIAATMEMERLYTMPDPLACVNAMAYHAGEALNWHFDRSVFTTTLLLQAPEAGGAFEYRTDLRSEDDPNHDGIARLLNGEDPELKRLRLTPGTLNVFRGKNTPHRVTPIRGGTARIITVFSLYDRPGVRFTPEEQLGFFGRTG